MPQVDADACWLKSELPACQRCGSVAGPNFLLLGDSGWIEDPTLAQ
jgi:hypothetical protein